MAEVVDEFPEELSSGRGGYKYPWDEWFDGKIRKLEHGKDYDVSTTAFKSRAYTAAQERGLQLEWRWNAGKDKPFIYIKAAKPEEPAE